jgi:hypothetical protein
LNAVDYDAEIGHDEISDALLNDAAPILLFGGSGAAPLGAATARFCSTVARWR